MYLRWRRLLPRGVRLVPVELPGRGIRSAEPFVEDFDSLVEQLCREHESICDERYAFFGHSMGALVAYGMTARWWEQSLALPDILFASASPAPSRRDPAFFVGKDSDAALCADLRGQGGTPDEVFESAELLRIALDTLRADYRACASFRYRPRTPLPLPIQVLAGRQDDIDVERILAWKAETAAQFSAQWFEGGHFYLRQHEAAVTGIVSRRLAEDYSEVAS